MDYFLDNLDHELERHQNKLRSLMLQQKQAQADVQAGNIYEETVRILADKLKEIDEKLKEGNAA